MHVEETPNYEKVTKKTEKNIKSTNKEDSPNDFTML